MGSGTLPLRGGLRDDDFPNGRRSGMMPLCFGTPKTDRQGRNGRRVSPLQLPRLRGFVQLGH
jgi:hypothetical protein